MCIRDRVYAYIFKAATNQITTTDPQRAAEIFDQLVSDPMASLCWQWLALIVTCTVVMPVSYTHLDVYKRQGLM